MNNNQLTTYYIPTNPNIKSGPIYTLYINNNTNLDLSSIISSNTNKPTTLDLSSIISNSIVSNPSKITIDKKEYDQLSKNNKLFQEQLTKANKEIELSINKQKQIITALEKLNIEYQNLLKNIIAKDDKNG